MILLLWMEREYLTILSLRSSSMGRRGLGLLSSKFRMMMSSPRFRSQLHSSVATRMTCCLISLSTKPSGNLLRGPSSLRLYEHPSLSAFAQLLVPEQFAHLDRVWQFPSRRRACRSALVRRSFLFLPARVHAVRQEYIGVSADQTADVYTGSSGAMRRRSVCWHCRAFGYATARLLSACVYFFS